MSFTSKSLCSIMCWFILQHCGKYIMIISLLVLRFWEPHNVYRSCCIVRVGGAQSLLRTHRDSLSHTHRHTHTNLCSQLRGQLCKHFYSKLLKAVAFIDLYVLLSVNRLVLTAHERPMRRWHGKRSYGDISACPSWPTLTIHSAIPQWLHVSKSLNEGVCGMFIGYVWRCHNESVLHHGGDLARMKCVKVHCFKSDS